MLGTSAPLARAANKARSSLDHTREHLQDELQTAEELYRAAHRTEEDAEREGEELPEELAPREAEEVVDEEYRPLMDDESGGEGRSPRRSRRGSRSRRDGGEGGEVKVRKLEVWLAYLIFFILGACILLGWNQIIVSSGYFAARLKDSRFETSFSSFVSLTFTTANLVFLALANATQGKANLSRRISLSIIVMTANLILFIISTQIKEINAGLFFTFLVISSIVLAAAASYLQNAVVALSASFGPSYLNQILSGQGAIGFAVAMIQFIAAYGAAKAAQKKSAPALLDQPTLLQRGLFTVRDEIVELAVPPKSVRMSAFTFFLAVGIFAAVSWISYAVLVRLPLYRLVVRANFDSAAADDNASTKSASAPLADLRVVERKIRHLGLALFLVFAVTLSVFPSITATIQSVHAGQPDAKLLQSPALFVPLGFAVFAAGDWLGRVLPQWEKLAFTNWKALWVATVARIVFIPLFLLCNQTAGGDSNPLIKSDILFFLIMLLFAISNGYISTLLMLAAVLEPSLDEDEIDIASPSMAFYLTAGLAFGSFASFGVRAIVSGESDDDGDEKTDRPTSSSSSPFSGLSCLLLVLVLAVAVALAVFLANKESGTSSATSGSSSSSGSGSGTKKAATTGGSATFVATSAGTAVAAATTVPTDFFSSLASKYSMTPASVSSLSMPSTAIPSATAAVSYVDQNWNKIKGGGDYLSFVEDPLDSSNKETVLQVEYPKGSYTSHGDGGGVMNMQVGVFGGNKNRAMISYEVGFMKGFDFVLGGKLPGAFGGDPSSYCTGGQMSTACFSLRLMWRENGEGEVYAYVPVYDGYCGGGDSSVYCHDGTAISFNRGSFTFQAGVYNTVTEVAIINSDPNTADGVLALYAGETLAFERKDVVFRVNESVHFSAFAISTFFGGSTSDYASTADAFSYFRNMRFWEGDDLSGESGATVTATIPS
ncbi:hypothetical protein JCM8097_001047 [Rhodosporidiobolus ruineniae]